MNANWNLPPGCTADEIDAHNSPICDHCGDPISGTIYIREAEGTALRDRYYCESCAYEIAAQEAAKN